MFQDTLDQLSTKTQGREAFITKSYQHLLLAVGTFIAFEYYLFQSGLAERIAQVLFGNWLLVIGGFMVVAYLASSVAASAQTKGAQYAALFGFSMAEAIIFVPLVYFAEMKLPGVVKTAAVATGLAFLGLTAIAFQTRKDFSFMGGFLRWGGFIALGLIVGSLLFGFELGFLFTAAMLLYAGAAILYETSNIIHHYPEDRYVSAGLGLFSSVMLMAWYMIQAVMSLSGD
ncbi:MAG: Bax inhibitor-1 family protein [Gammaproteobacteria bacterium]